MHVPDGYFDAPTAVATTIAATAIVGQAFTRARREHHQQHAAGMIGLVTTFVFAAQMVNFAVGSGTSGHLIGAALAAVLLGPWAAVLSITLVLTVQAVLFADGGITALGANVVLMAGVGVAVGWGVFRLARAVLPRRPASVPVAGALGALVSVPACALAFAALYAIGGTHDVALPDLVAAMVGWHSLIGLGEALVTGAVLAGVMALRPDLVRGADDLAPAARDRSAEQVVA
ncbi:cobalt/nickel transport system permease protein [Mumia flava]|uniref:Cobalt/nickel transport system permease protein n=1 Tax=Mumia flava TaxID=1348852 RepID=A0A0B2BLJ2_9ACTN|nr:energy-coupling factor ABC transporter permease [Mumia flava]PJJ56377.1 cobalt/nickel transport system permease protein [Mumia flava]